jgi:hypothetical protein
MIRKLALAALAASLLGLMPAAAGAGEGPSLWQKYLRLAADQVPTRIEPNNFSRIPRGRSARDFYSCGATYCTSDSYCCSSDVGSYCCPGYSQCGGDGYCY